MQLLPLSKLVENLRIEAKVSTNPSRGLDSTEYLTQVINRNYELLWDDKDWNHLALQHEERLVSLQAGQNIYTLPEALDSTTVKEAFTSLGGTWIPLEYGISLHHYTEVDPVRNERSDPVIRWEIRSPTTFEVHPMPASNVEKIAFEGARRKFKPLVNQEDIALIDSQCIVLMGAAEILASSGSKDAQLKLTLATNRINKMTARSSSKRRFGFGEISDSRSGCNERLRVAYVRN